MSSSDPPPPVIYDPVQHQHLLPQIAKVHRDCVHHDAMLATILDIDNTSKVQSYWHSRHEEVIAGSRIIFLQLTADGNELAGVVALSMPWAETGPFRGIVEKLMVSPSHRKKGIARRLMERLEEAAREQRRELLTLDTEVGSAAEQVYPRLGYTTVGIIPRYGISPKDGRLVDEKFFYKDLRDEQV